MNDLITIKLSTDDIHALRRLAGKANGAIGGSVKSKKRAAASRRNGKTYWNEQKRATAAA